MVKLLRPGDLTQEELVDLTSRLQSRVGAGEKHHTAAPFFIAELHLTLEKNHLEVEGAEEPGISHFTSAQQLRAA